jgi:hypothetical protein
MKQILLLLVVAGLTVVLTGCGDQSAPPSSNAATNTNNVSTNK